MLDALHMDLHGETVPQSSAAFTVEGDGVSHFELAFMVLQAAF